MILSTTDFERTIPFHHVAVFLGNFGDIGMAWAFVDIVEEHLHDIIAALGFTLDRVIDGVAAPSCHAILLGFLSREIPKSHTLDKPVNLKVYSFYHF